MENKSDNNSHVVLFAVAGLFIIAGAYLIIFKPDQSPTEEPEPPIGISCDTKMDTITMKEDVMEGVIKSDDKIKVEMGFYNCKEPAEGDIAVVQTSGRPDPIIRFVRVLPKDQFRLEQKQNVFHLKVNGSIMANADGKPYSFSEQKSRLLKLYEKSLKGKMEDGIYFIFSNRTDGGYDSTRFGPVEKSKLVGKVILSETP